MEVILSMTLGITMLLIVLLGRKIRTHFANIYLMLILSMVLIGTSYVVYIQNNTSNLSFVGHAINSLPILFGSLVYFYVRHSIFLEKKANYTDLFHLAPYFLGLLSDYFDNNAHFFTSLFLNIGLKISLSIGYLIITLRLILVNKKKAENYFSNSEKINFEWLIFVVKIGLISYLIYLVIMLLWAFNIELVSHIETYANLIVFVFVVAISYYGIASSSVFAPIQASPISEKNIREEEKNTDNLQKNDLKELINSQKAEEIYRELLNLMQHKKMYLNENLMLDDLAKEINLHSKYVSYVINTQAQKTFFDFVNHFRVHEFNAQVLDARNQHLTFLAIAYSCGFGSKSSFNRAYKHEMGISPSEFVKQQLQ